MSDDWHEIELSELPDLAADEASLLEMHSVLNTISLLVGELNLIGHALTGDLEWMRDALGTCQSMITALKDRSQAIRCATNLSVYRSRISQDVERSLSLHPKSRNDPGILESLSNIESVFDVLALRAREILARTAAPEKWELLQIHDLEKDFRIFFAAVEKNSKGRYRVAFNKHRESPSDYGVSLLLESVRGDALLMPSVMVDVMRDLMANSRKYSFPGATISAALREDQQQLSFTVADTGRGIPKEEMKSVAFFGIRGSNVADVRTQGGGFGLTKALCVTKQFGGRMWLASRVGKGTRIHIQLPLPGGRDGEGRKLGARS